MKPLVYPTPRGTYWFDTRKPKAYINELLRFVFSLKKLDSSCQSKTSEKLWFFSEIDHDATQFNSMLFVNTNFPSQISAYFGLEFQLSEQITGKEYVDFSKLIVCAELLRALEENIRDGCP